MKKLVFVFALMFGAIFSSCGNNTGNAEQKDSVSITDSVEAIDTITVDSAALDTLSPDTLYA